MSKESSVAPKERVNIRYKPATGNAKEEVELPLKLMMIGDYTMKPDETPVEERPLVDVNADNFNDVMRSYKLSLDIAVENKIDESPEAGKIAAGLTFNSLRDFEPEQVVRQVPEMKKLLELREALIALKGPLGNVPAFRKAVQGALDDSAARDRLLGEITNATVSKP